MQKAFFLTKLNKQTNKHQVKQGEKKREANRSTDECAEQKRHQIIAMFVNVVSCEVQIIVIKS